MGSAGLYSGQYENNHTITFKYVVNFADYVYCEDRVVVDGKLVTSRGPGTCFEFALAVVEQLQGKEKSDSLIPPMLLTL